MNYVLWLTAKSRHVFVSWGGITAGFCEGRGLDAERSAQSPQEGAWASAPPGQSCALTEQGLSGATAVPRCLRDRPLSPARPAGVLCGFLPNIHLSDRYVSVAFFFPREGPMKTLAWRGTCVTRPPHRRTSSHSLALGGSLAAEINITGWSANRVPRYLPADKRRSRRQSCGARTEGGLGAEPRLV